MADFTADDYQIDQDLHRVPSATAGHESTAVLFVHGFTGDGIGTWGEFPPRLRDDPELAGLDFFFWQYPSKLNPAYLITRAFWSADPGIDLIGQSLRTMVEHRLGDYERLMFVAHSMGGLVLQSFILEEIERGAPECLERLTEVMLYATPSGGLSSARRFGFFKKQVADMSNVGPFIEKLRAEWRSRIDDERADPDRTAQFRLTLVAGQRDKFVPEESSLDPFPLDEREVVPGNHVQLVKPEKSGDLTFRVLKKRLRRDHPTADERRLIHGESEEAVATMGLIRAAADLGDVAALVKIADDVLDGEVTMPTVEGALGLALVQQMKYERGVKLFERYLAYEMPDGTKPFAQDAHAIQQLAVGLSGLGRNQDALERLAALPPEIGEDSETMGIRAGRMKREWLENRDNPFPARRAFQTYSAAFDTAKSTGDVGQILYNGINTAFMSLALGLPHEDTAHEMLDIAAAEDSPDYWTHATRAEALLLLGRIDEAHQGYQLSFAQAENPRYLATTAAQALNIIDLLGDPPAASALRQSVEKQFPALDEAIANQDSEMEARELAG